jgi:hypothetical protein
MDVIGVPILVFGDGHYLAWGVLGIEAQVAKVGGITGA